MRTRSSWILGLLAAVLAVSTMQPAAPNRALPGKHATAGATVANDCKRKDEDKTLTLAAVNFSSLVAKKHGFPKKADEYMVVKKKHGFPKKADDYMFAKNKHGYPSKADGYLVVSSIA